jgi:hypothetical protein
MTANIIQNTKVHHNQQLLQLLQGHLGSSHDQPAERNQKEDGRSQ